MKDNSSNIEINIRTTTASMIWMLSGTFMQMAVNVTSMAILARLLTATDFGIVSAAQIVIRFSVLFSEIGMGASIIQRDNLTQNHIRTAHTFSIVSSFVTTILIIVFSKDIANIISISELDKYLPALSIVFPLYGLSTVGKSLLQRNMRFKELARIDVFSKFIGYILIAVPCAFLGFGVWTLILANLGQSLISTICILLLQPFSKKIYFDFKSFKELFYFGGGFTLSRISAFLANEVDYMVVGRFLGADALGLYTKAYQLMAMPARYFGEAMDKVLFPAMAKVQNDKEILKNAFLKGYNIIAYIAFPLSCIMWILAPQIIRVFLGVGWEGTILPFRILSMTMFFRTSYKISDSLVRAKGAIYNSAWRKIIYAVCVFIGAIVGQNFGITGVALGTTLAIMINFILMTNLSLRLLGISWKSIIFMRSRSVVLSVLVSGLVIVFSYVFDSIGLNVFTALIINLCMTMLVILTIVYLKPKIIIGENEKWLLDKLLKGLPSKYIKIFYKLVKI